METQHQDENQQFWQKFWTDATGIEKLGAIFVVIAFFGDVFLWSTAGMELYILSIIMAGAGTVIGVMKKNKYLIGAGAFVVIYLLIFMGDAMMIDDLYDDIYDW